MGRSRSHPCVSSNQHNLQWALFLLNTTYLLPALPQEGVTMATLSASFFVIFAEECFLWKEKQQLVQLSKMTSSRFFFFFFFFSLSLFILFYTNLCLFTPSLLYFLLSSFLLPSVFCLFFFRPLSSLLSFPISLTSLFLCSNITLLRTDIK